MKDDDYSSEVGLVPEETWYEYLKLFDDASLYQTPSYGKNSKGGKHLINFVLRKNNRVVAVAQIRLFLMPYLNRGIAYLLRGPIWKLKDEDENPETLDKMLRALYEEFVVRRKLVLIVAPNLLKEIDKNYESLLFNNNFRIKFLNIKRRTILVDLSKPANELRKKLRRSWRQNLTKAENSNVTIENNGHNNFHVLDEIHGEVIKRKDFKTDLTVENFGRIQSDLPEDNKLNVMLCKNNEDYVSGLVGVAMGNTGLALIGGTTAVGLQCAPNSYYLLMWKMCEWARNAGCRWFDLGGINPSTNPGCYQFKSGIRGLEVTYLDTYQASKPGISCMMCKVLDFMMWVCNKIRKLI